MFLSKTLHTELLKAAEQNGVNKMLTWGGIGAGVGGAYGMFSDTGTTMEGAFKGAILGGGAAAGLKYYGNRYATGMGHVVGESLDTLKAADFSTTNPVNFNKALNSMNDLGMMSQQFNPAYFGIGQNVKFSDNVLNATSINKRVAQAFQDVNTSYTQARGSLSDTDFISQRLGGTAERDRSSSIYSSSNSLIKDLRSKYGSV